MVLMINGSFYDFNKSDPKQIHLVDYFDLQQNRLKEEIIYYQSNVLSTIYKYTISHFMYDLFCVELY